MKEKPKEMTMVKWKAEGLEMKMLEPLIKQLGEWKAFLKGVRLDVQLELMKVWGRAWMLAFHLEFEKGKSLKAHEMGLWMGQTWRD